MKIINIILAIVIFFMYGCTNKYVLDKPVKSGPGGDIVIKSEESKGDLYIKQTIGTLLLIGGIYGLSRIAPKDNQ